MRAGPSTGIPTKSEQSDLNIALNGLHGDAPHLVLAPLDIADCVFTTGWAVNLAQQLQTAAIVLSDQFIGQSTAIVSEPRRCPNAVPADATATEGGEYLRYKLTSSGISTLASPGDVDQRFTADGMEHNEKGPPAAKDSDHQRQLQKRHDKLFDFDYGEDWAELAGSGTVALLSFGSSSTVVAEAAGLLAERGIAARVISMRLLAPLQTSALQAALAGCEHLVVVEQNHSRQLYHYLRGQMDFQQQVHSYAVAGPVPLNPRQIAQQVTEAVGE